MSYRARIVFNGPGDRAHTFYSTAKPTEAQVDEMLADMGALLRGAVSVTVQRNADPEGKGGWQTRSALTTALSDGTVSEWQT